MMKSFQDKHVWIIGASSGIGKALAENLSKKGAKLILSARGAQTLESLNQSLGGQHMVLPLDVSDFANSQKQFEAINNLDCVIHLAAIYEPTALKDLKHDATQQMLAVNLMGAFHVIELVLPKFRAQGYGQIALCGSVAGYVGLPNGQPYSATKAAIINLAESLRAEEQNKTIDVRLISPGFVETPMTDKNDFDMPMRISAEQAAEHIAKGLLATKFEIHFPKKFTFLVTFLRLLPYGLYFKIAEKIGARKNKQSKQ